MLEMQDQIKIRLQNELTSFSARSLDIKRDAIKQG